MAKEKWDPFKDLITIQERMNRLFNEAFEKSKSQGRSTAAGTWTPPVDIYETEKDIIMMAELPGFSQENIDLQIVEDTLTLRGVRKLQRGVEEENYLRIERSYGSFRRVFPLPCSIKKDRVSAVFKDGILKVTMPKIKVLKPKRIKVDFD